MPTIPCTSAVTLPAEIEEAWFEYADCFLGFAYDRTSYSLDDISDKARELRSAIRTTLDAQKDAVALALGIEEPQSMSMDEILESIRALVAEHESSHSDDE